MVIVALSLEGVPGSGKTTRIKPLQEALQKKHPDWSFLTIPEPDKEFNEEHPLTHDPRDPQMISALKLFYSDQERWGFFFQIYAAAIRMKKYRELMKTLNPLDIVSPCKVIVIIMDRSLKTDQLFMDNLFTTETIKPIEFIGYNNFCEEFGDAVFGSMPFAHIFMNCSFEQSLRRVRLRDNKSEAQYTAKYHRSLFDKHEKLFDKLIENPVTGPYVGTMDTEFDIHAPENKSLWEGTVANVDAILSDLISGI